MSKTTKFIVEVPNVGVGGVKEKELQAKSFDRLLSSMPKHLKKKWTKISYPDENGIMISISRRESSLQQEPQQ